MSLSQDELRAIVRKERRPWLGRSGALLTALTAGHAYPTVNAARAASDIVSDRAAIAPAGAIHWFETGSYGQAALDLDGGGMNVVTASSVITEAWGYGVGVTSVARLRHTGRYLGWSLTYGERKVES